MNKLTTKTTPHTWMLHKFNRIMKSRGKAKWTVKRWPARMQFTREAVTFDVPKHNSVTCDEVHAMLDELFATGISAKEFIVAANRGLDVLGRDNETGPIKAFFGYKAGKSDDEVAKNAGLALWATYKESDPDEWVRVGSLAGESVDRFNAELVKMGNSLESVEWTDDEKYIIETLLEADEDALDDDDSDD